MFITIYYKILERRITTFCLDYSSYLLKKIFFIGFHIVFLSPGTMKSKNMSVLTLRPHLPLRNGVIILKCDYSDILNLKYGYCWHGK